MYSLSSGGQKFGISFRGQSQTVDGTGGSAEKNPLCVLLFFFLSFWYLTCAFFQSTPLQSLLLSSHPHFLLCSQISPYLPLKSNEGTEGWLRTQQKLTLCNLPLPLHLGGTYSTFFRNLPSILMLISC